MELNCICKNCSKKFHQKPSRIAIGKGKYCSRQCRVKDGYSPFWLGKKNPRWNNGKKTKRNYILISIPHHPFADSQGYVYEHRLVVEKRIGRYLLAEEKIHHINGIKNDNRDENLILVKNQSEHVIKYHNGKGGHFLRVTL